MKTVNQKHKIMFTATDSIHTEDLKVSDLVNLLTMNLWEKSNEIFAKHMSITNMSQKSGLQIEFGNYPGQIHSRVLNNIILYIRQKDSLNDFNYLKIGLDDENDECLLILAKDKSELRVVIENAYVKTGGFNSRAINNYGQFRIHEKDKSLTTIGVIDFTFYKIDKNELSQSGQQDLLNDITRAILLS